MGIDYVLDLACAPKKHLGVEGIIELVKARARAEAVLEMLRAEGDTRSPDEVSFQVVLQTPDGEKVEDVTVQGLLDKARALDAERDHCAGCPAGGDLPGFGCYKSIPYPIPEEAERWLLELLPDDVDTTAGQLLLRAIEDFEWNGELAAQMRDDGDTFFESRRALAVTWGEGDEEIEVDSDQVFQLLFHVGRISSTHAFMACLFFGVVPHDLDADDLGDPARRASALQTATVPQPPGEACEPIATFLHALVTAARLDVDVLIDG